MTTSPRTRSMVCRASRTSSAAWAAVGPCGELRQRERSRGGAIRIVVEMKALMISAILIASSTPAASGPSPTPTATGVVPTTAVPTPTPTATATVAAGLTRYTNTELGYSVDLPAGWRRGACSEGIVTTAPLVASEVFMGVPGAEEV